MSSNRMQRTERTSPIPAVRSERQTPTIMTSGKVQAIGWPEIKQTIDRGISPIKKFAKPAKDVDKGNI